MTQTGTEKKKKFRLLARNALTVDRTLQFQIEGIDFILYYTAQEHAVYILHIEFLSPVSLFIKQNTY
jgi:hypothetical protein